MCIPLQNQGGELVSVPARPKAQMIIFLLEILSGKIDDKPGISLNNVMGETIQDDTHHNHLWIQIDIGGKTNYQSVIPPSLSRTEAFALGTRHTAGILFASLSKNLFVHVPKLISKSFRG